MTGYATVHLHEHAVAAQANNAGIGTAFTLFFLPAIYLLIAKEHRAQETAEVPARVAVEPCT